jgi:hypothetical protein
MTPRSPTIGRPITDERIATIIDRIIVPALLDRLLQQRARSAPYPQEPPRRVESQPSA